MPVLALGGGYIPTFGGNITMPTIIYGMKILAQNVQGITVPNSEHYIPEEAAKIYNRSVIEILWEQYEWTISLTY